MVISISEATSLLLEYFVVIISKFMTFIFDEFVILPFGDLFGFNLTFGYFIIASFTFSLLFRFLLAVPQTGGGGSRGKAKRSKKDSSSSSSSSSDN